MFELSSFYFLYCNAVQIAWMWGLVWIFVAHMGLVKQKSAFEHAQSAHSEQPVHVHSIFRACSPFIHSEVSSLKFPLILLVDSIGPD